MQTAADITAEALRQNLKDLNEIVFKVRRLHLVGKEAPKASYRYLVALRRIHEQREKGIALGATGPLFGDLAPTPFRDQLVGITAEERKEREWKGVFAKFPFPIPFHYSIAAE